MNRFELNALRGGGRQRLAELSRRTRQVLLLAGATGAATGLAVALFDVVTAEVILHRVRELPVWVQAIAPGLGVLLAWVALRSIGRGTSPATSDEYIRAFHDVSGRMPLRPVPARILASIATLGSGGPLGYEGPALYTGAAIGAWLQRRLSRYFGPDDAKVLLVAGAAAGVAAIFKAPVTGIVFALEVPYQEDLARRMLLPASISAAASYVVFASIAGTDAILPVAGRPPFNLLDLGGAAIIGLVCGVLARAFAALIAHAKSFASRTPAPLRISLAGGVLALTVVAAHGLGSTRLATGPGYEALRWALDPQHAVWAIVALGTLRVLGSAAVIGGGGVGGLFIPLVIQGALIGRAVGGLFDADSTSLFPVVGMAAFLGAGYRVPLAGVVFVAEFTGRPGFVVPGLIAAVVAQLVMGRRSLSPYQVAGRVGHLEQRLRLPLTTVIDADARTVPSDATVEELFWQHLVGARQQAAPVVDGDDYMGLVCVEDLASLERDAWSRTLVRDVMRTDVPAADPGWSLADAIRAMEAAGVDRLAVCSDRRFIGVIRALDLVQLDEVVGRSEGRT